MLHPDRQRGRDAESRRRTALAWQESVSEAYDADARQKCADQ